MKTKTPKDYQYVDVTIRSPDVSRRVKRAVKTIGGTKAAARGKILELGIEAYEREIAAQVEKKQVGK